MNLIRLWVENEETPDLVCLQLGICNNATCHLFPYPNKMTPFMKAFPSFDAYEMPQHSRAHDRQARGGFDPLKWLWDKLSTIVNSHLPLVDLDGDKFSGKRVMITTAYEYEYDRRFVTIILLFYFYQRTRKSHGTIAFAL